jgi:carotenoid cleavage dioxygenase-like enzyme
MLLATQIAKGPIATVKVPLRLKPAYHGSWNDARFVKSSGLV